MITISQEDLERNSKEIINNLVASAEWEDFEQAVLGAKKFTIDAILKALHDGDPERLASAIIDELLCEYFRDAAESKAKEDERVREQDEEHERNYTIKSAYQRSKNGY